MRELGSDTQRGFTLVEATITVAILALAVSVVIPAVSNITRAEMRETAGILAGTVRSLYDQAALSGQTYRLVLNLEKNTISSEATEQVEKG